MQAQLVRGHAVSHSQRIDAPVRRLARQQFPQHHAEAPHVAGLAERAELDGLGRHPGVGARLRHARGPVGLARQAEVGDF